MQGIFLESSIPFRYAHDAHKSGCLSLSTPTPSLDTTIHDVVQQNKKITTWCRHLSIVGSLQVTGCQSDLVMPATPQAYMKYDIL